MSGSHYAPEPPSLARPDEHTRYDLRPPVQHGDLDALRLEYESLREAHAYLSKRLDELTRAAMADIGGHGHRLSALEGEVAALKVHGKAQAQAIDRIADKVQVLMLQDGAQ